MPLAFVSLSPPRLPLLLALVLSWRPAAAQELPPPGGWPLRSVAELHPAAGLPGGLVPYRQGQRWGLADTTGRVWVQPVFTEEPPLAWEGAGQPAFAGRFTQASGFWRGRALVRQGAQYGLIDTLGRWVLPPQAERLRFDNPTDAHYRQRELSDPRGLFDHFGPRWQYTTLPADSMLVLTSGPRGYGLRGSRAGHGVLPPTGFDKWPTAWRGAVVGEHQGQPWGISLRGQPFGPDVPASWPPGGAHPACAGCGPAHPPVVRTEQGYRTRGGRPLWQD